MFPRGGRLRGEPNECLRTEEANRKRKPTESDEQRCHNSEERTELNNLLEFPFYRQPKPIAFHNI